VLTVKDNQPTLHRTVADFFLGHAETDFTEPTLRRHKTVDRNTAARRTREYFVAPTPAELTRLGRVERPAQRWPGDSKTPGRR